MKPFTYHSQITVISLSLLTLFTSISSTLFGTVADDVAAARASWAAEDALSAIESLESALAVDPLHEEANFLLGVFKLATLTEDSLLSTLVADAGVLHYSANFFNIDTRFDIYQYALPLGTNAAAWNYQTNESTSGGDAVQSGSISHGEISVMELTISGSGELQFAYKTSTEPDDFLEVYLDGELVFSASGDSGAWSNRWIWLGDDVEHQLLFVYRKNDSVNGGSDAVWIDNLSFKYQQLAPTVPNSLSDALDHESLVVSVADTEVEARSYTPMPILDDTFTSTDCLDWLNTSAVPCFLEAKELLAKVTSTDFLTELSASETLGMSQAVDYYDVLMLRAAVEGSLAFIGLLDQHNIDIFIDELIQRHLLVAPFDPDYMGTSHVTLEWLFDTYPKFLEMDSEVDFSQEEAALRNLKDLYFQASDGIFSRSAEVRRLFNVGKERPAPDTAWFAQTVESRSGNGDAVKSGNVQQWLSGEWKRVTSSMSITVEGPGVLTYWWKLSNYNNLENPRQEIALMRRDSPWDVYLDSIWGYSSGWTQVTVDIPEGTQTLEWRYSLYDDHLSAADGAFVDEVTYTPSLGDVPELGPGSNPLDFAIDAALGVYSANTTVNSLGISEVADLEIREFLTDMVTSFDGSAVTSIGEFTTRPFLDGDVDLNAVLPEFYFNQIVHGTAIDPSFGGILPSMSEESLNLELQLHDYLFWKVYQLIVNSSTGGVGSGSGTYDIGVDASISAVPAAGYRFSGWSGSGVVDPAASTTTVLMDQDREIFANFLVNSTNGYNTMLAAFSGETDINRIGPEADFDNDSISNFEEYVFGSNPASAEEHYRLEPLTETIGLYSRLVLNLEVRSDDRELIYVARLSPDLSTWESVYLFFNGSTWLTSDSSLLMVQSAVPNGDGTWTLTLKGQVSELGRSFIKFEVYSPY